MGSPGQLPAVPVASQPIPGQSPPQAGASAAANNGNVSSEALTRENSSQKVTGKTEDKPMTLDDASKLLKDHLKSLPSDLQFEFDKETGITSFKVINPVTKEVIREYPPKEVVEMAKRLKEASQDKGAGLLVDEQH